MSVESYLALFLTFFGWRQYGVIYEILAATRLLYVPFLVLIVTSIVAPLTSQEARGAAETSLRRMEIGLFLMILAVMLAVVPFNELTASVLTYRKPCDTAFGPAEEVQAGSTGTTYDDTFSDTIASSVRIPIWWNLIMSINAGINRYAIANIGCATDISGYRMRLESERIANVELVNELARFGRYCFIPSVSKWQREQGGGQNFTGGVEPLDDELLWYGAPRFFGTPGYYDTYRARAGIPGWPYQTGRDVDYSDEAVSLMSVDELANAGRPYCNEWWEDGSRGLRAKVLEQVEPDVITGLLQAGGSATQDEYEEAVVRSMVTTTLAAAPVASSFSPSLNEEAAFDLTRLGAGLGLDIAEFAFVPMMYALRAAAPIVQAFMLAGLYGLLLFALWVGFYSWRVIFGASIALFTVSFWSVLWHWAWFLEQKLLLVMYPEAAEQVGGTLMATLSSTYIVGGDYAFKLQILQYVSATMYIGFPLLFSFVMSVGGIGFIATLTSIASVVQKPVQSGSGQAGSAATNVATDAVTRGRG